MDLILSVREPNIGPVTDKTVHILEVSGADAEVIEGARRYATETQKKQNRWFFKFYRALFRLHA